MTEQDKILTLTRPAGADGGPNSPLRGERRTGSPTATGRAKAPRLEPQPPPPTKTTDSEQFTTDHSSESGARDGSPGTAESAVIGSRPHADPGDATQSNGGPNPAAAGGQGIDLRKAGGSRNTDGSRTTGGGDDLGADQPSSAETDVTAAGLASVRREGRDAALAHLAWMASTLVMGIIGLLRAGWPALWGDELATWGMTTVPWSQMWGTTQDIDTVLTPYYLLIRGWAQLVGDSDLMLRLPSVIAMAGTAGLVAAIGSRLASARIGLLAGLAFAVFPTTSRYAQEARPYALVAFAAVLSTWLLVRLIDGKGRHRSGRRALEHLPYVLAVALLGLLHPVAVALLGAHAIAVLFLRPRAFLWWFSAALLGAGPAGWLLWLGQRQKDQVSWIPLAAPDDLVRYPAALFGTSLVGGLVLALALLAVSFRRPAVVFSMWALVPTAAIFAAGMFTPLWTTRYLLFTLPAWALLAAMALGRAPLIRGALAVVTIALISLPQQLEIREVAGHSQDTRAVAATLTAAAKPADGILYGTSADGRVGRDIVAHYVSDSARPKDLLATRPARTGGSVKVPECTDFQRCIGKTGRLWVLRIGNREDPLAGMGEDKIKYLGSYDVLQVWHPDGLTLALLSRRAG